MKNSKLMLFTAVAISTILGVGAAASADLPMKSMPYAAPAPVFSWTGCYVGVHAGAGVMRDSVGATSMMGLGTNYTGTGGLAGGQLGCNYQDGNWVFGAEGEGYWSGMKTSNVSTDSLGFGDTDTAKNKYDFSIAARAGIAFDRTLVYGKAGWVWGKFDFLSTNTDSCCSFSGGPFASSSSASGTLNGLLLGVGIEHALTNNWTVKLEYNYLNYGSKAVSFTSCSNGIGPSTVCFPDGTVTVRADKQIFKIGANYLFNMGSAPLVAKY
jgi:outer membrane immunogenic protein